MALGWNSYRAYWGGGSANEAAAALHHAIELRRGPNVRALIASDKASSLRVARRLDLSYEAETEIAGKAVGMCTREREEAEPPQRWRRLHSPYAASFNRARRLPEPVLDAGSGARS